MLRLRYKELLIYFYEINKDMLEEDFLPELRAFLSAEHQNDDEIAEIMKINNSELQYLKTICVEQMTLNCDKKDSVILKEDNEKTDIRYYDKYFDVYTSGLMSINQDFTPSQSIYYLDDESIEGLFKYFYAKIMDSSAKYIYTEKEKECVYDILEALIKHTGKYDYIVDVLNDIYSQMVADSYDEDEDEEIYNDEIESKYDDDFSEQDHDIENNDGAQLGKQKQTEETYIPTKEEIQKMFDDCYDDILLALNNNYPDLYQRDKFINFFTATCYAIEKIHNEHSDLHCVLPYMLESVSEFDIEKLDKSLIIAFLANLFEMCFIGYGINMNAMYGLNNKEALDVYRKIDIDLYSKISDENNNLFIFGEPLSKYIDSIIISEYEGIRINYGFQKLQEEGYKATEIDLKDIDNPSDGEHKSFLNDIYRKILSYDIYKDYTEFDLNEKKKSYIRNATIRRIIALFFEGIHYNYDKLKREYKVLHDDLIRGIYQSDAELTELFIQYGNKMLEIYYSLVKDNNIANLCQNKIYNDNLINFITALDPSSTSEFINRIDSKNIASIMNCNNLLVQLSDANIVTKEDFLRIIKELKISKTAAVGSIATIVYENMLYSEDKDEEIPFLVEHNSLEDIVKIFFENEKIFRKMINYFRKYMGNDFSVDKELKCRKDIKVKQKEYVISRINPFYKEEQHTFK